MQAIKSCCVGDPGVGKTCMLISYTTNTFPGGNQIPTVFDNYSANVMVDAVPVNLGLWDIAGAEDVERLSYLAYPGTNIFLLCFAINRPPFWESIKNKWLPRILHECPGVPFVIVGLKQDLRNDEETHRQLAEVGAKMPTKEEGIQFAQSVGAAGYFECSSLFGHGLAAVFTTAIRIHWDMGKNVRNVPSLGTKLITKFKSIFSYHKGTSAVNAKESSTKYQILPTQVWVHVMSFLGHVDVCRARSVCKYLLVVCDDDSLWKIMCNKYGLFFGFKLKVDKPHKHYFIDNLHFHVHIPSL